MELQKTLRTDLVFKGRGLHTGHEAELIVKPAPPDTGILFIHVNSEGDRTPISAVAESIQAGEGRQTSLGSGTARIRTVEHLMATFHGLGIDNAIVEIKGDEIPGFDGSAREFLDRFLETGFTTQEHPRNYLYVTEPVYLDEGGQSIIVLPYREGLKLSYSLSYQHRDLHDQFFSSVITPEVFEREIAPARTFCLKEEAVLLKSKGFGQGADLANTLVFENDLPIQNTLRFPDEACRHKVMDLLGDLYLVGQPVRGHVIACRSGHNQNMKLVAQLRAKFGKEKKNSMSYSKQPSQQLDVN